MPSPTAVLILRSLLLVDIVAMAILAVFYLRQRQMTWVDYCGWGLVVLILPVVGPFVVIALHPGKRRIT